ncbi:uncharacterized protein LOC141628875 [Silene latifolia]|uniref:uncharacterized protein LOC141628875 n=1 Tax=Silene latifolia TaxID=37657 RepID=UPI003D77C38F
MDNLRRRLQELGEKWANELPLVLWSDRMTPKTATGQTPFCLVFGAEAVIPSEVVVPTQRYGSMIWELNSVEMARSPDTIDELRASAKIGLAAYKQSVTISYNKNVKIRLLELPRTTIALAPHDTTSGTSHRSSGIFYFQASLNASL